MQTIIFMFKENKSLNSAFLLVPQDETLVDFTDELWRVCEPSIVFGVQYRILIRYHEIYIRQYEQGVVIWGIILNPFKIKEIVFVLTHFVR